jgi:hypothetical protein
MAGRRFLAQTVDEPWTPADWEQWRAEKADLELRCYLTERATRPVPFESDKTASEEGS